MVAEWRYEKMFQMQPYPLWIVFEYEGVPVVEPIVAWTTSLDNKLQPVVPYAGEMLVLQGWHEVFPTADAAEEYVLEMS